MLFRSTESPTGPFDRYHVRYSRSNDGARTFERPRDVSGIQTEQFESVSFPSLDLDGADNVYAIWDLFPNHRGYPRGLGFTFSRDGGQTFSSPEVIPGSADRALGVNGSQQGFLMRKLAVNESAELAVVSSTFKKNEMSHIWLIRGQADRR